MNIMINVLFLFTAGLLYADSLHALSSDLCNEGLTASLQNVGPYLQSGNKPEYRELCTLYGVIVEQCEYSPSDKLLIQEGYEKSCKSKKVQLWLASKGMSLAVQRPTFVMLTISSIVTLLISKMVVYSR